jgi:hypothetical protein
VLQSQVWGPHDEEKQEMLWDGSIRVANQQKGDTMLKIGGNEESNSLQGNVIIGHVTLYSSLGFNGTRGNTWRLLILSPSDPIL